ncbi:MAG: T9SS type A sorting domain-containing protein [Paludibacter sp.]|nr:T9SS type A sorting domain-containing protein [Paludibacter sp.]
MKIHLHKTAIIYLLLLFYGTIPFELCAQDIVSYAYDQAGNRISRKIVDLTVTPNPTHVKKSEDSAPIEDQLGERTITIYPNPTKGTLAVEIKGGDEKDELRIILYNSEGKQLQNKKVEQGTTPINMSTYPVAYYILRVIAGENVKEFKIIKN